MHIDGRPTVARIHDPPPPKPTYQPPKPQKLLMAPKPQLPNNSIPSVPIVPASNSPNRLQTAAWINRSAHENMKSNPSPSLSPLRRSPAPPPSISEIPSVV